jgi:hypothetical protein
VSEAAQDRNAAEAEQRLLNAGYVPIIPYEMWFGPGGVLSTAQALERLEALEKGKGP